VNTLAIGGAMANTFLFAQGKPVGRSLCERDLADTARNILKSAAERGCEIILPDDTVTADKLEPGVVTRTVGLNAVPPNAMILDVGPETVARIGTALEKSRTLVWNGPVGAFETPPFDRATVAIAKKVAELTEAGKLMSVAGGGDTVAALHAAGVADRLSYVSTAGGAFLEWLEGRELPGVAALAVT
jgi:phosphoglycerate kinase